MKNATKWYRQGVTYQLSHSPGFLHGTLMTSWVSNKFSGSSTLAYLSIHSLPCILLWAPSCSIKSDCLKSMMKMTLKLLCIWSSRRSTRMLTHSMSTWLLQELPSLSQKSLHINYYKCRTRNLSSKMTVPSWTMSIQDITLQIKFCNPKSLKRPQFHKDLLRISKEVRIQT